MAELLFFEPALDDLNASLPAWWAQGNPASELAIILGVVAGLVDELAVAVEQIHLDQGIATASEDALIYEWAVLLGAEGEQLPDNQDALRAYLIARAGEDGSLESLFSTLLALLEPTNRDSAVPERDGLHFPTDESGVHFPDDGTGLTFPAQGWLEITEAFAEYRIDVTVLSSLIFDRAVFARAVNRFRQAHMVAPTITEAP